MLAGQLEITIAVAVPTICSNSGGVTSEKVARIYMYTYVYIVIINRKE